MRFQCQPGCTKCCDKKGFVYLTESDATHIAEFLGMSAEVFEKRYVYRTRYLRRLRAARSSECPFLTKEGCSIHSVKPTQCRLFPFWPELVNSRKEWKRTAEWCPGIGKGPLVQIQAAREKAHEMLDAYPRTYGK